MLTDKDIKKLIEVFPTREEVALKSDFEDLRKDFSKLQTSVDRFVKRADDYFQEMKMLSHKVDRHEKWILQLAQKVGVELEH